MKWPAGIALAALALAVGGCGGDEEDAPDEVSTNDALACVQDQGLKAVATAGDEPLGITGSLRVSLPPENRITVDFFDDAEQASDYSAGQAAFLDPSGGSSELVGETVVIGALRAGAADELESVKRCVS